MTLIDPGYYSKYAQAQGSDQPIPWDVLKQQYLTGSKYIADPEMHEMAVSLKAASALAQRDEQGDADPRRVEALQKAFPDMSPDTLSLAIENGVDGDVGTMMQLADRDHQAALAAAKQKDQQANSDVWSKGPFGWLKGASRLTFAALEAPFQEIANFQRVAANVLDDKSTMSLADQLSSSFTATDLGMMAATVAQGDPVDTGSGWFVDGQVRKEVGQLTAGIRSATPVGPGQDTATLMRQARERGASKEEVLSIRDSRLPYGEAATMGRDAAGVVFTPGSQPYSIVSGLGDAASRVVDPSMYVGFGEASKVGRVAAAGAKGFAKGAAVDEAVATGFKGGRAAADAMRERVMNPKATIARGAAANKPYATADHAGERIDALQKKWGEVQGETGLAAMRKALASELKKQARSTSARQRRLKFAEDANPVDMAMRLARKDKERAQQLLFDAESAVRADFARRQADAQSLLDELQSGQPAAKAADDAAAAADETASTAADDAATFTDDDGTQWVEYTPGMVAKESGVEPGDDEALQAWAEENPQALEGMWWLDEGTDTWYAVGPDDLNWGDLEDYTFRRDVAGPDTTRPDGPLAVSGDLYHGTTVPWRGGDFNLAETEQPRGGYFFSEFADVGNAYGKSRQYPPMTMEWLGKMYPEATPSSLKQLAQEQGWPQRLLFKPDEGKIEPLKLGQVTFDNIAAGRIVRRNPDARTIKTQVVGDIVDLVPPKKAGAPTRDTGKSWSKADMEVWVEQARKDGMSEEDIQGVLDLNYSGGVGAKTGGRQALVKWFQSLPADSQALLVDFAGSSQARNAVSRAGGDMSALKPGSINSIASTWRDWMLLHMADDVPGTSRLAELMQEYGMGAVRLEGGADGAVVFALPQHIAGSSTFGQAVEDMGRSASKAAPKAADEAAAAADDTAAAADEAAAAADDAAAAQPSQEVLDAIAKAQQEIDAHRLPEEFKDVDPAAEAEARTRLEDAMREFLRQTKQDPEKRMSDDELAALRQKVAEAEAQVFDLETQAATLAGNWALANGLDDLLDPQQVASLGAGLVESGPKWAKDAITEMLGKVRDTNGDPGVAVDLALEALFDGKADKVFDSLYWLAKNGGIGDVMTFTRAKIPTYLYRAIETAESPQQIRELVTGAMGRGAFSQQVGRMRTLQMYTRVGPAGNAMGDDLSAFAKTVHGMKVPNLLRWSTDAAKTNVPWAHMAHIEDEQAMLWLVHDGIDYLFPNKWGRAEKRAFQNEWCTEMLHASTGVQRKAVLYKMLDDVAEQTIDRSGLDGVLSAKQMDELKQSVRDGFKLADESNQGTRVYNADIQQALKDADQEYVTLNGEGIGAGNMPLYEDLVNEMAWIPNPKILHRLTRKAKRAMKNGGDANAVFKLANGVMDEYWRTAVLVFKPSYMIRNILDGQARMFLSDHPSMFTNPLGIIAMAMDSVRPHSSATSRMGKFIESMGGPDKDIRGEFFGSQKDLDLKTDDMLRRYQEEILVRQVSMADMALDPTDAMKRIGAVVQIYDRHAKRGNQKFWEARADELNLMMQSSLARQVLGIITERPLSDLEMYARRNGMQSDLPGALVHMAMQGPLRADLEQLGVLAGRNIEKFKDNPTLGEAIRTESGLREFLFDESNPVSYASTWRRRLSYRASDEPDAERLWATGALDMLLEGDTMRRVATTSASKGEKELANASRQQMAQALATELRKELRVPADEMRYDSLQAASPLFMEAAKDPWLRRSVNWFFAKSAATEKSFMWVPEYRFAYWDYVADTIGTMGRADAAKALASARESMTGKFGWERRTMKKLESNAASAENGNYNVSFWDIGRYADNYAAQHMQELFYDATQRNKIAHAMRYVFPFAQAWVNSMKVWGEYGIKNSNKLYAAGVGYQAARSKDTNWAYEMAGVDGYDPTQGLVYQDPKTGNMNVHAPGPLQWLLGGASLVGSGVASALGDGSVANAPKVDVTTPLQSMNLLFQSGAGPGFGPIPTTLAGLANRSKFYRDLPDIAGLKTQLDQGGAPYDPNSKSPGVADTLLSSMVPGYAKGTAAVLGMGYGTFAEKYEHAAIGWLWSTNKERYSDANGNMDRAGAQRLQEDATAVAKGLAFGQSISKAFSPGSVIPKFYAQVDNGQMIPQAVLVQEFRDEIAASQGDYSSAWARMQEKYGVEPLLTLMPTTKDRVTPTNDAWNFLNDHRGELDGFEDVVPLMVSGAGYSVQYAKQLRTMGRNEPVPIEEQVTRANRLLMSAQKDRIDLAMQRGQIDKDQHAALRARLEEEFAGIDTGNVEVPDTEKTIQTMEKALDASPSLKSTPGGEAVTVYLRLRSQALAEAQRLGNKGFSKSADTAHLREWLRQSGDALAAEVPAFATGAWYVFQKEL